MTRPLIFCLLLAACAAPAADRRVATCRARALEDPTVKAAIERANSPLQQVRVPGVREQQQAIDRAVDRCLGGPGAPGGVEPVQRQ